MATIITLTFNGYHEFLAILAKYAIGMFYITHKNTATVNTSSNGEDVLEESQKTQEK